MRDCYTKSANNFWDFGVSEPERYFHIPFPFIKNPNGYMNKTVISKDLCVSLMTIAMIF